MENDQKKLAKSTINRPFSIAMLNYQRVPRKHGGFMGYFWIFSVSFW
jgi:hypothetical protein